jgi:glycosyltransferase involved in cell wall biosynthesis
MTDAAHNIAARPSAPIGGVWIIMATFNGGEFLAEQLASLGRQSWTNWRLLIRDDGSTDGTTARLDSARQLDSRVEVLDDRLGRLGPARAFGTLLAQAASRGAGVVFCCDQDDVWHPEKLARQLAALNSLEQFGRGGQPALVYSDARLVDRAGRSLGCTFASKVAAPAESARLLPTFLLGNRVPGCTLAVNRALLELATPQPDETPMHDWWLAALAAAAGDIVWMPDALVDYRQHSDNSVGAPGLLSRATTAWRRWRTSDPRSTLTAAPGLARRLASRLRERGLDAGLATLDAFETAVSQRSASSRWSRLRHWMKAETRLGAVFSRTERWKLAALAWSGEPRNRSPATCGIPESSCPETSISSISPDN